MWHEYSRAKDEMFSFTDTKQSPWYVIDSDNKNIAYLNMIHHLLTLIPYEEIVPPKIELPAIQETGYLRPPDPSSSRSGPIDTPAAPPTPRQREAG